jgi:AraC-like DNA-binding protein
MRIARAPQAALAPFVERVWFSDDAPVKGVREHVLPTGAMHLVLRLDDHPLRLVECGAVREVGTSIIGGARTTFYVKDVTQASRAVGAMLRAGAAAPLFGAPASELAEQHTSLDDLWRDTRELRDELRILAPADALARFEDMLVARLPRVRCMHPAVAHALARFDALATVSDVADETGYSHRRFVDVFRDAVGLAPKRYCRVQRLNRAIAGITRGDAFIAIAHGAGYADQAHFAREFRELSGVSPTEYRRLAPSFNHHLQIPSRPKRDLAP